LNNQKPLGGGKHFRRLDELNFLHRQVSRREKQIRDTQLTTLTRTSNKQLLACDHVSQLHKQFYFESERNLTERISVVEIRRSLQTAHINFTLGSHDIIALFVRAPAFPQSHSSALFAGKL
jgi:hypothetical protein